jgi:hypothetical protein
VPVGLYSPARAGSPSLSVSAEDCPREGGSNPSRAAAWKTTTGRRIYHRSVARDYARHKFEPHDQLFDQSNKEFFREHFGMRLNELADGAVVRLMAPPTHRSIAFTPANSD